MAIEFAERRSIPLADARTLLSSVDLRGAAVPDLPVPGEAAPTAVLHPPEPPQADPPEVLHTPEPPQADPTEVLHTPQVEPGGSEFAASEPGSAAASHEDFGAEPYAPAAHEAESHAREEHQAEAAAADHHEPVVHDPRLAEEAAPAADLGWEAEARMVLENGIRAISGEIRNSLDFHRSQEGGGTVARVVLSGFALDLPGFSDALAASLGVEVHPAAVALADAQLADRVSTHRLAIAAGLAATEAPE
jgi:hypothetical protein